MDDKSLEKRIKLLKKHKIREFRDESIHIVFGEPEFKISKAQKKAIAKAEEQIPVDLRAENINDMETIQFWSSPDATREGETPLTDDRPLS